MTKNIFILQLFLFPQSIGTSRYENYSLGIKNINLSISGSSIIVQTAIFLEYAVKLVSATRPNSENTPNFINESISWGAGPRASQFLILGSKAKAILEGRPTPNIDDINSLAIPILRHRVLTNFNAETQGLKVEDVISQLLEKLN